MVFPTGSISGVYYRKYCRCLLQDEVVLTTGSTSGVFTTGSTGCV